MLESSMNFELLLSFALLLLFEERFGSGFAPVVSLTMATAPFLPDELLAAALNAVKLGNDESKVTEFTPSVLDTSGMTTTYFCFRPFKDFVDSVSEIQDDFEHESVCLSSDELARLRRDAATLDVDCLEAAERLAVEIGTAVFGTVELEAKPAVDVATVKSLTVEPTEVEQYSSEIVDDLSSGHKGTDALTGRERTISRLCSDHLHDVKDSQTSH